MKELIDLFTQYYDARGEYSDGKPTVTVFENHILTIAAQLWIIIELSAFWLNKYGQSLTNYSNNLKENIALQEKVINSGKTTQS